MMSSPDKTVATTAATTVTTFDRAMRVGDQIELRAAEDDAFLRVAGVLGGICPASGDGSPFYAVAFGQLPDTNKFGRKKLIFLGEIESQLPDIFFDRLVELSRSFFCWRWHFNTSDADDIAVESFRRLLKNYAAQHDIVQIKLVPALTMDWNTGVAVIQQWVADEALEIRPGTVLAAQLGKMTKADRQTSRRSAFYAPDALRAVLGHAAHGRHYWSSGGHSHKNDFYF